MKQSLLFLVVLVGLIACVYSHAVLDTPTPFNTNPSTKSPCGADITNDMKSVAQATWVAGEKVI